MSFNLPSCNETILCHPKNCFKNKQKLLYHTIFNISTLYKIVFNLIARVTKLYCMLITLASSHVLFCTLAVTSHWSMAILDVMYTVTCAVSE